MIIQSTHLLKRHRLLAICHLCFAFTLLFWLLGYPFMKEHYAIKAKMHLYEFIMGSHPVNDAAKQENSTQFSNLPSETKESLLSDYRLLKQQLSRSFLGKTQDALKIIFIEISPFALGWLFFSLLIPVMILLQVKGARSSTWILPLLTFAYLIENLSSQNSRSIDAGLFPTEEHLIQNYRHAPLSNQILEQKHELERAWNTYLIENFAKEAPSAQVEEFDAQARKGLYFFTLKRLQIWNENHNVLVERNMREKNSIFLLILYVIWNVLFARCITKKMKVKPQLTSLNHA